MDLLPRSRQPQPPAQARPAVNAAFTFVALRILEKLPPDATYADWFKGIRKVLPAPQYPQTPNLHGTETMKKLKVFE